MALQNIGEQVFSQIKKKQMEHMAETAQAVEAVVAEALDRAERAADGDGSDQSDSAAAAAWGSAAVMVGGYPQFVCSLSMQHCGSVRSPKAERVKNIRGGGADPQLTCFGASIGGDSVGEGGEHEDDDEEEFRCKMM